MKDSHIHVFACSSDPDVKLVWEPGTDRVFTALVPAEQFEQWKGQMVKKGFKMCVVTPCCVSEAVSSAA